MTKALIETLKYHMKQALNGGRLEEAQAILARLKKEDPLSPATCGFELEFYINSNRFSEAEALAEQLCRLFPESARIIFLAGKLAYRLKRYAEAEAHFRESQRLFPNLQTQHWLGKTLTQAGKFDEAESLLHAALEQRRNVLLDLAWLYERKNNLDAALKALDEFLVESPGDRYAVEQRARIRAKMLEPEELVDEAGSLASLGEDVPAAFFPEYIQRLFETGQSLRARDEIAAGMRGMDMKTAVRVAWICYRVQAYDLACTLFLAQVGANKSNFKYLAALESAASKCSRLSEVAAAYRVLIPEARQLYGRLRSLRSRGKI